MVSLLLLTVAIRLARMVWLLASTGLELLDSLELISTQQVPFSQLACWVLQLLLPARLALQLPRSAAMAACRALLAATYWQQPCWLSWLPTREVHAMAWLEAGATRDIGLASSQGHLITIGLSLAASRLLGQTFASLQSLAGEHVGLSTRHARAWARGSPFHTQARASRAAITVPPTLRSAGVILLHQMLCWSTFGPPGSPTPVDPLSVGWLAAVHVLVHTRLQRILGAHTAQSDAAPVAHGPPKLLTASHLCVSCTFWLAAVLIVTDAAATTILGVFSVDDLAPWDTVLLYWLLLALCWEPWAHKARLDWLVWQQGISRLPQLLRSMPPGQAFAGSWWPLRLLRRALQAIIALVRGCPCIVWVTKPKVCHVRCCTTRLNPMPAAAG